MIKVGNTLLENTKVVAVQKATDGNSVTVLTEGGHSLQFIGAEGEKIWKYFGGEKKDLYDAPQSGSFETGVPY